MARRRRRRNTPILPWILLALVAAGGYWFWRHPPAWFVRAPAPVSNAPVEVALPPPGGALDVCGLVTPAALAKALGVDSVDARHMGAGADVPAQGACTWRYSQAGRSGQVVALVFTRASLAAGGVAGDAPAYFRSIATGLEYSYKETPKPLAGVGDEAVTGGFGSAAAPAQLVARRGDSVLDLVLTGVERAPAEQVARLLVPALP